MQLLITAPKDDERATKRLERLEKKLGGSTEMMAEVAEFVISRNRATWAKGVKLQPNTILYKEKYGESQEPLQETGRMKDELTTDHGIKLLRPTELVFGSASRVEKGGEMIPLAKAHLLQHGSKHQQKHKVLKVTPVTRRQVADIIKAKMTEE